MGRLSRDYHSRWTNYEDRGGIVEVLDGVEYEIEVTLGGKYPGDARGTFFGYWYCLTCAQQRRPASSRGTDAPTAERALEKARIDFKTHYGLVHATGVAPTAIPDCGGYPTDAIRTPSSDTLDPQSSLLIAQVSSLHDRLAFALRQIPVSLALRLACDFAGHALTVTSQNRQYDWEQSEGKRNEEALARLRKYLEAGSLDPQTILSIRSCVSYLPSPSPGIFEIAAAAIDRENAAQHLYRMAGLARRYVAYRGTEYPHHDGPSREADRAELLWQLQHLESRLADAASD